MARIAKSLTAPEEGYAHRDHRSKKGSIPGYRWKKDTKKRVRRMREMGDVAEEKKRKGKWPV